MDRKESKLPAVRSIAWLDAFLAECIPNIRRRESDKAKYDQNLSNRLYLRISNRLPKSGLANAVQILRDLLEHHEQKDNRRCNELDQRRRPLGSRPQHRRSHDENKEKKR